MSSIRRTNRRACRQAKMNAHCAVLLLAIVLIASVSSAPLPIVLSRPVAHVRASEEALALAVFERSDKVVHEILYGNGGSSSHQHGYYSHHGHSPRPPFDDDLARAHHAEQAGFAGKGNQQAVDDGNANDQGNDASNAKAAQLAGGGGGGGGAMGHNVAHANNSSGPHSVNVLSGDTIAIGGNGGKGGDGGRGGKNGNEGGQTSTGGHSRRRPGRAGRRAG